MNDKSKKDDKKPAPAKGLVEIMASEVHLNPNTFSHTVKSILPGNITPEQFTAFLMVCHEHRLNPVTREIYGFEAHGKIQPIVSIDGWLKIINNREEFDGMEYEDHVDDDDNLTAVTCIIYRSDRKHPTKVTEYMKECKRNTDTWKNWPARMLRHKATIQCARYAFGFAGIYDADEGERIAAGNDPDIIDGIAEIVPDGEQSAADSLKNKIRDKVGADDLAPETDADEASEVEMMDAGGQPGDDKPVDDDWVKDYDNAG